MSSIARIFIVLNLLLTALVLGWASNLMSADQNWMEKHDTVLAAKDAELAGKDEEITNLNTEVASLKESSGRHREERDANAAALTRTTSDLEVEREKSAAAQATVSKFSQTISGIDEGRKATQDKFDQAQEDKVAAIDARREAEESAKDAGDGQRAAEEALAAANRTIASLETDVNTLTKNLAKTDTTLAMVVDIYNINLDEVTAQPEISGAVVVVSNDVKPGLLGINRGKADGVKRGYVFSIYNGSQFKGRARVETVEDNMCFAVVESVYENRAFSTGDMAATRL
ncbi:MAG: hypothetical protein P1V35_15910 [Planctomycetota bacterium]|nr:hypothetical protein [Planctomycetota bacterium]